ncbi:helix-turn-helix domain-containing protein [Kitasatospora purpeofusca]|uniref:helix-turn-helix domain-containing protein n=1 Tax=Kitasatospora purpeofusca TaxID=67352 RepID=UPI0036D40767
MRIHRIPDHTPGYTILDNRHVVRKHALSWAARGLLVYLLSLPDGAREDVRTLAAKSVEGRATVARALRELEVAGHYVRRTVRDPVTGRVRTVVSVHEVPVADKAVHTLPPLPASPAAGAPGVGKAGSPSLRVRTVERKEPSVLPVMAAPRMTEGMGLLLELGRRDPALALAGKPLVDQAARVEGLLAGGWSADALLGVLSAPLPGQLTHSVAAVLGGRLTKVPPAPWGRGAVAVPRPRRHECPGRDGMCGRPVAGAGELCAGCEGDQTVSRTLK